MHETLPNYALKTQVHTHTTVHLTVSVRRSVAEALRAPAPSWPLPERCLKPAANSLRRIGARDAIILMQSSDQADQAATALLTLFKGRAARPALASLTTTVPSGQQHWMDSSGQMMSRATWYQRPANALAVANGKRSRRACPLRSTRSVPERPDENLNLTFTLETSVCRGLNERVNGWAAQAPLPVAVKSRATSSCHVLSAVINRHSSRSELSVQALQVNRVPKQECRMVNGPGRKCFWTPTIATAAAAV
jgi:hypothetical protein